MDGYVLLLTGSAPYLGGPRTWQSLRDAAPDLEFRDLDLLDVAAYDNLIDSIKCAIQTAAEGATAIVAHGAVAAMALEAVENSQISVPVVLLSPVAVTKDSAFLRVLRALLGGPVGRLLTAAARSKRQKMLKDCAYLRRQMELWVRSDKISDALVQEARARVADPRMDAFIERTRETLCTLLTPTMAFERFNGSSYFGNGPMDRKFRKRIPGMFIEAAWSAPMLETPELIADRLRNLRPSEPICQWEDRRSIEPGFAQP